MKTNMLHCSPRFGTIALGTAMVLASTCSSLAVLRGPYTPDAYTLHLWHLDESAPPCVDFAPAPYATNLMWLTNGATLSNPSWPGFGTCLNTYDGGPAGLPNMGQTDAYLSFVPNVSGLGDEVAITYDDLNDPNTRAFTYEAIVQVQFDPLTTGTPGNGRTGNMQIISGENDGGEPRAYDDRVFQWAYDVIGGEGNTAPAIEFINIDAAGSICIVQWDVPLTGPDAIVSNGWYHVAVTYNGQPNTPDNMRLYWTAMDGTRTNASLLTPNGNYYDRMIADLPAHKTMDFCVGNSLRGADNRLNGNWVGQIDEVRMSSIARDPTDMLFVSTNVLLIAGAYPTNALVTPGQPVTFRVIVSGLPTLNYQWRTNGVPIPEATGQTYSIASAQLANALNYDVVVTNNYSAVTSSVAKLTILSPQSLTWTGTVDTNWDSATTTNWVDSGSNPQIYLDGDGVTFDASGTLQPVVNLVDSFAPTNVVVAADFDYTFMTTTGAGKIRGSTGLTKRGTGNLIVDTDNTYTGPTLLQSGTLTLGMNDALGSLGSGAISNGTTLIFHRSDYGFVMSNTISGPGGLVNNASAAPANVAYTPNVTLTGSNSFSGEIVLNGGILTLGRTNAIGNCTKVTLNPLVGGRAYGTTLGLAGAIVPANVSVILSTGPEPTTPARSSIRALGGTNTFNAPISIVDLSPADAASTASIGADAGTKVTFNGSITTANFAGQLLTRGSGGLGIFNAPVVLPGCAVSHTDSSTFVFNTTGNSWARTEITAGTIGIGANNALPAAISVFTGGNLDLAGFNQQLFSLWDYDPNGYTNASDSGFTTTGVVGNSSTSSDSALTLMGATNTIFRGTIVDSLGTGTHKLGLTLGGGYSLTLSNNCTYSADTLVNNGSLILGGAGAIPNTRNIVLASGTTLDASGRSDATLTLSPIQTLKGNGAFSVLGNLTSGGTIELKLNKSGATLTNDSIHGSSVVTYGGTLKLDISGSPLTTADSFKLFYASGYGGAFTSLVPASPGVGLAWNVSTLATDGTLRISPRPAFSNISVQGGTNLILAATNGPGGGPYYLLESTNVALPLSNWTRFSTNNFNGSGAFNITNAIVPGIPHQFFNIQVP
jgi:autotransporter-associated beta strand protein